jgi:radical SAM protein with 4Fe4S-binding SPASM domain
VTMKYLYKLLYYPKIRRLSVKKLLNFLRLRREYRQMKAILDSYPSIAIIDPTNICNLKCPICPTGQGRQNKRGYMEVDLFKKIMGELSPYLFEVWLYNWGEPFLNSSVFELIEITNKSNISSTISTNLNYFPKGYERNLIKSGLERLVVSFDGVSQESYSTYRRGGKIDQVIENVERIVDAKKSAKSILPLIKLQFLVNRFNEHEMTQAERLAEKLNVDIEFKSFMFNAKKDSTRRKWEPSNRKFTRYNIKTGEDLTCKKYLCVWLWRYAVVNWDGKVTPCCNWMGEGIFEFGDLETNSFREIWNNEYFISARKAMKKEKSLPITCCHGCLGMPPSIDEDSLV